MEQFYLEKWLHDRVRQTAISEPDLGSQMGDEAMTSISRSDIEKYQLFKLKKMLHYVYRRSEFYRELFRSKGISPDDVRSLDDLVKLPFTDPADLAEAPTKFVCIPLEEITRDYVYYTCGTTGLTKKLACTQQDIERTVDFISAGMRTVATGGDTVLILLPGSRPNSQGDLMSNGVRKMGGIPVVGDLYASPEEYVNIIERHHPRVIFASPSRIHRITMGYEPKCRLGNLGVKVLFLTCEHLSEARRKKLQDIWNCDVYAHYGATEMGLAVSIECHAHNGFHFNEADLLLEIVDPDTGETIDDNREGELVFTTLTREGTPLIRYKTHDLSRVIRHPCSCGADTMQRIGSLVKKAESEVTIGAGDVIHSCFFDDILYSLFEVVDYQMVITRHGNQDHLKFKVEVTEEGRGLEDEIKRRLMATPVIKKNLNPGKLAELEVELAGFGTFKSRTRVKKLIINNPEDMDDKIERKTCVAPNC